MDRLTFEWDENKNRINKRKHSVSFEAALLIVVCHCYRASETVIRLISARKATRTELKQYQGRWSG